MDGAAKEQKTKRASGIVRKKAEAGKEVDVGVAVEGRLPKAKNGEPKGKKQLENKATSTGRGETEGKENIAAKSLEANSEEAQMSPSLAKKEKAESPRTALGGGKRKKGGEGTANTEAVRNGRVAKKKTPPPQPHLQPEPTATRKNLTTKALLLVPVISVGDS